MAEQPCLGFVGLGAMGRPMAKNLLAAGYQVHVVDISPASAAALVEAGAVAAESIADLGDCDAVITMLPRPADVTSVVLGDGGLIGVLRPGSLVIDMSTGTPATAQEIAVRLGSAGIDSVDCPVGRTQEHAEAGTLLLLAGGSTEAVDRAEPIVHTLGNELIRCGGPGMGQAMKLVNNMLAIVLMQGIAEALALGRRSGLTLDTMRTVMGKTMAQTALLDVGLPLRALRGNFDPGFALSLAEKDIALATALAAELDLEVPVAEQTQRTCYDAVASGHGRQDIGFLLALRGALDTPGPTR